MDQNGQSCEGESRYAVWSIKHADTLALLGKLKVRVRVSAVTKAKIESALSSSFKDFEDGIQHFVAKTEGGVSATVTRDKTDYASGEITVMSPDEFLAMREPSRDEGPTRCAGNPKLEI